MPSHRTRSFPPKSKRVVFAGWDSDLERKRSERGIEFRRRVKEDSKKKKMSRQQRDANNIVKAEQAYQALILSVNRGPLADLSTIQNLDNGFRIIFNNFFSRLVQWLPLGSAIRRGTGRRASTSDKLRGLADSGIASQQIQGHSIAMTLLTSIAQLAAFEDAVLTRPTVSSGSEDEAQDANDDDVAPEDDDGEDAHDDEGDDVEDAHDDDDVDAPQDAAGDGVDAPPAAAGADRGRNRDQEDQQPRRNVRPRKSS